MLIVIVAAFASRLFAQQTDVTRPRLSHQSQPISQSAISNEATASADSDPEDISAKASGIVLKNGLTLPTTGHVWAADVFEGKSQLIQLKYVPTDIDKHAGSNLLKANMAPFVYKPKQTVEIQGAIANTRLHDPHTVIYIRGYGSTDEDAAASAEITSTQSEMVLVSLESKKDRRIVSTIAFTQVTGNAARNSQAINVTIERVDDTDWKKITPREPLTPGEYALAPMPRGQNLFPTAVFDFAVDPTAPSNVDSITQSTRP
ncbi:hypothetical protein [Acidobacterium sp. S8]|uniref:hypothetical protein n=1 Tax=Acidobacterium sp. S8 TaxID=1641854 RepID=UPI00131AC794|nr:hypothetical protein [Acidobacterium sp. S8]